MRKFLTIRRTLLLNCVLISYCIINVYVIFPVYKTNTLGNTREINITWPSSRQNTELGIYALNYMDNFVKASNAQFPNMEGPGANGQKLDVGTLNDNPMYKKIRNETMVNGINVFLSNIIGSKRELEDRRPTACKTILYPHNLPPVSIVIVCRDETVNTLARTIFGALYTSPARLLKEILILDDGSANADLLITLQIYEATVDKVKVIRNDKPSGLMKARQKGIEATSSDYFVVLDSHVEFNPGWLEPIIHRLVQEPNNLLTSRIGVINRETFEYTVGGNPEQFMCFEQASMNEQWVPYKQEYKQMRNGSVGPIESCMVPGMMMAMRKAYFLQIGGLDTGMEIWGSEHIEMSVKVWMCGGKVETVPCSIIAHLYRPQPWERVHNTSNHIFKNKLRFVEVWMDGEAKDVALTYLHTRSKKIDAGNLTNRHRLRIENNCKSYDYFVNKIKSLTDGIYFTHHPKAFGEIYNRKFNKCIDYAKLPEGYKLITYQCTGGDNQYLLLTEAGQIKVHTAWVTLDANHTQLVVTKDTNNWWKSSDYLWTYTGNGQIKHASVTKCLAIAANGHIGLETCSKTSNQLWEWPKNNT